MKKLVLATMILLIATPLLAAKIPYRYCEPCVDIDETLTITTDVQYVSGSTVGQVGEEYAYGFWGCGGATYTFSLCPEYGGSATYDTAMSIQGPDNCGAYLFCNDDWCGLQSEVTAWMAPADGNYICVVDAYYGTGDYTMAYFGSAITATDDANWSVIKSLY